MSSTPPLRRRFDPAPQVDARSSADVPLRQYMEQAAQTIVDAGGQPVSDSNGSNLYPGRADTYLTTVMFDPVLKRNIKVRVRLRVTVQMMPFEQP